MNKIFICGRLTKEVELSYSKNDSSLAIAKYCIAVDRQKKEGQEDKADFFNIVTFGKAGEFASKYFHKGQRVLVSGRVQIEKKDDKTYVNVISETQEFADGKQEKKEDVMAGFEPAEDSLPFV